MKTLIYSSYAWCINKGSHLTRIYSCMSTSLRTCRLCCCAYMDTDSVQYSQCYWCHQRPFLRRNNKLHVLWPCMAHRLDLSIGLHMAYTVKCNVVWVPAGQLQPSWQWVSQVSLAWGVEQLSGHELLHSKKSMLYGQSLSVKTNTSVTCL